MTGGQPDIRNSCIQGLSLFAGNGNIGDDPLLVDADGPDDVAGTQDDDLRLQFGSPCLDAGDNGALPDDWADLDKDGDTSEPVPFDLAGNARIFNGTVDMGAYEGPSQAFVIAELPVTVPEGGTASFFVSLSLEPGETVEIRVEFLHGDSDISLVSGAALSFDASNFAMPQAVVLAAAGDADRISDLAFFSVRSPGLPEQQVVAVEGDAQPPIRFVDAYAQGANDGRTWENAFTDLQTALAEVKRARGAIPEIWVAAGLYKPDQGQSQSPGDRFATFQLINGVAIRGGLAGDEDAATFDLDDRDFAANETVLSGDLNGNDVEDLASGIACYSDSGVPSECGAFDRDGDGDVDSSDLAVEENSYHVVTANDTDETAVLDGVTIRAGNGAFAHGGGIHIDEGNPTLVRCTFRANFAPGHAGAMYNRAASPTLIECTFFGNRSILNNGGGIYNIYGSAPKLLRCRFVANGASAGGGMYNVFDSSPTITDCVFQENVAKYGGGGMHNHSSGATVVDCVFVGNSADLGGGMYNRENAQPTVTGCRFEGNTAKSIGGGMCGEQAGVTLVGSTFHANSAEKGGAVAATPLDVTAINCVFSENISATRGGAIAVVIGSDVMIQGCLFVGNRAMGVGSIGGGALDIAGFGGNRTLRNCTFHGNSAPAGTGGGILRGLGSPLTVTNCLLWTNADSGGTDESAQITSALGTPVVNYSCIQGWTGAWGGVGNFGGDPVADDPRFVDPLGADGAAGTADDDLHVRPDSPCINAGDPAGDYSGQVDLDGRDRVIDGRVDIGAYEFSSDRDGDGLVDDDDACPDSALAETIVVSGRDSGVENVLFEDGCTMTDLIEACSVGVLNHGQRVSCVARLLADWRRDGLITGADEGRIQRSVGPGDVDFDGDVDGGDFLLFSRCFNGPGNSPGKGCVTGAADIDGDGDVDGGDFLTFANCFNGPRNPPNCP